MILSSTSLRILERASESEGDSLKLHLHFVHSHPVCLSSHIQRMRRDTVLKHKAAHPLRKIFMGAHFNSRAMQQGQGRKKYALPLLMMANYKFAIANLKQP